MMTVSSNKGPETMSGGGLVGELLFDAIVTYYSGFVEEKFVEEMKGQMGVWRVLVGDFGYRIGFLFRRSGQ